MTHEETVALRQLSRTLLLLVDQDCLVQLTPGDSRQALVLGSAANVLKEHRGTAERVLAQRIEPQTTNDPDIALALAILITLSREGQLDPKPEDEPQVTLAKYAAKRLLEDYDEK